MQTWSAPLWNTSDLLSQGSPPGQILHTLISYIDRLTGMELVAYAGVVLAMVLRMQVASAQTIKPRQSELA